MDYEGWSRDARLTHLQHRVATVPDEEIAALDLDVLAYLEDTPLWRLFLTWPTWQHARMAWSIWKFRRKLRRARP